MHWQDRASLNLGRKKVIATILFLFICVLGAISGVIFLFGSPQAHAMGDEDFVGPFPSWANVQTMYGVKGDGITDDTTAIQSALNDLGSATTTLYFPAGTYLITKTLNLSNKIYVNIIGEDPSDTKIIWGGPSSATSTMLYINGMAYSRIDRLTFNGQRVANVAVDQSWDGSTGYFDTQNQYADDTFENVATGFRCGNLGYGCAETSMLRDQYLNDDVAGVAMKNYNALDMWIWDSFFQNDAEGVTNYPGAGDFHVFNSIFENSTSSDITIGATGIFNFYGNYSTGSRQFLYAVNSGNPANITINDNTILDTAATTSISVGNFGPVVLIDNIIRSRAAVTTGPVVMATGSKFFDLFSMGNTFTVSSSTYTINGHYHSIDNQVVAPDTINSTMPALPGTPQNNVPQVFEVSPGSTSAQIQQVIDEAVTSTSTEPVVHIPAGTYDMTATLDVPADSNLQIIGDGYYSRLFWNGTTTGPVIRLEGPSKAILREISVGGNNHSANGIEVDDADQPGSSVFMESPFLTHSYTNLFSDALDYTDVQLHDFEHSDAQSVNNSPSVEVTGGPYAAHDLWQGGVTNIFAGASSGNNLSYAVSGGGHLGVRYTWNDSGGGGGEQIADASGTSTLSYVGSTLYQPNCSSGSSATFNNFHGTAALVNLSTTCNANITGTGSNGAALGLGLVTINNDSFVNNSTPAVASELLNSLTASSTTPVPSTNFAEISEQGTASEPFLVMTLKQLRTEVPSLLSPLPSNVTDVRFYRVFVDAALTGIHISAAPVITPPMLSSIVASAASNVATVSWTTDEIADTQVEYGTTPSYVASTTYDGAYVTTHTATLSPLSACTTYHYAVISTDVYGNQSISSDQTLKTTGCPSPGSISPILGSVSSAPSFLPAPFFHDDNITLTQSATSTTATTTVSSTSTVISKVSTLTTLQIQSILSILSSFGVGKATLAKVSAALMGISTPGVNIAIGAPCFFTRNLTIGMRGIDVTCLQKGLLSLGYAIQAGATGYFGMETRAAVAVWQKMVDIIPAHGYFGIISRRKFEKE